MYGRINYNIYNKVKSIIGDTYRKFNQLSCGINFAGDKLFVFHVDLIS